jgi:hypothetical protein
MPEAQGFLHRPPSKVASLRHWLSANRTRCASVTSLPLKSAGSETAGTASVRKRCEDGFDPIGRHGWRSRRRDQDGPAKLAANEPGALRLLPLEDQFLALERERNLLTGLELQGFPKALGDHQLAFRRDRRAIHGGILTRLTGEVKRPQAKDGIQPVAWPCAWVDLVWFSCIVPPLACVC